MSKVAVAMSGGVDSSVAAVLAVEKYGKENVFGVTMKLFCYGENESSDKSCCSLDAINDAAAVCKQLGIPHYVINLEKEFEKEIVGNFVTEYEAGRTPNPCIRCNRLIKFEHLLRKVQELGAEVLATGHYARILPTHVIPTLNPSSAQAPVGIQKEGGLDSWLATRNDGILGLYKGLDPAKDQSYFLFNMTQEQLKHVWFPLGELTKPETRKLAEKYGLKTAQKTESQDICFITTSTQEFLAGKVEAKSGNIVDTKGEVLGKHNGLPFYTVGQRKGLGGGFPEPMYVTHLNVEKNELVVGREEELYDDEMEIDEVTCISGEPKLPAEFDVKIRYNSNASPATLSRVIPAKGGIQKGEGLDSWIATRNDGEGLMRVKFNSSQRAITPGQSAVFYRGDEVIGGGIVLYTCKS